MHLRAAAFGATSAAATASAGPARAVSYARLVLSPCVTRNAILVRFVSLSYLTYDYSFQFIIYDKLPYFIHI